MKIKWYLGLSIFFLVMLFSCTKEQVAENNGLIGKWRLTETYNGYVMGGSSLWSKVSLKDSHTLEFTDNGQYFKKAEASGSYQQCSGTYQLITGNMIEINSTCQLVVERTTISELTNRNLIIDYQGREGIIRYKYLAE